MREQFDSCSYDELTQCLKARIAWLREYKKLRKDKETREKYPQICGGGMLMKAFIEKIEVRRLLHMRRILRKSGRKNWDSRYLSEGGPYYGKAQQRKPAE